MRLEQVIAFSLFPAHQHEYTFMESEVTNRQEKQ